MALVPYPVYNIERAAVPAPASGVRGRCGSNGPIRFRRDTTVWQNMTIAFPAPHSREGLRPIDTSRDLPQVVELLKLVFGDSLTGEPSLFGEGGSQVNELFFRLNPAAARLSNGFVWQSDGRVIANATLLTTRAWDRYLVANVAVHPEYRRQGIARGLMQAITDNVRKRGGRSILLQVVKGNYKAIDLYESLGYRSIGDMVTWYATASRVREIFVDAEEKEQWRISPLATSRWREAYELDTTHVPADLNWPEPLPRDAYRRTLWNKAGDFLNGRLFESWSTTDTNDRLSGLATIYGEWGRSHYVTLRVRPDFAGQLERPLLAKVIRRLRYLPRRNVRIDHPEADDVTSALLKESNFTTQRTLTHMRLDVDR